MGKSTDKETQRLRESEEKYRKMIERANDGIFAIDPETSRIVEANPKAEEMTGYSSSELLRMTVDQLHPPEEKDTAEKLFANVVKEGHGFASDLHFLTKKGTLITIDVSASLITYGGHKIIQRICRDVTEHRKLEAACAAQRDYFEFILNTLPIGVGVKRDVDRAPMLEFENEKLKSMFHGDPMKDSHIRWHGSPVEESMMAKDAIDETGLHTEERQSSSGRIYHFMRKFFENTDGTLSEIQVVRDVTRRRELEEKVRRSMEELENKVQERTRELREKQAQLVQSEKMAALGHLVAGVAHEINTPLGALKSNNDLTIRSYNKIKSLLEDESVPEHVRSNPAICKLLSGIEELNVVNKDAMERIVTLVRSLRKFARLDEADQDRIDIHEGLESTLTLVHHEIKNRIEVHRDYGALPKVHCHPNQINQVFMNILVNASQAIVDKGHIYVKTYAKDNGVVVEVRDTGKGISKENLGRVFDPGFTTKGAGVGTGLGLSIVYQIIQDHKGEIEFESELGKGTTVRIFLPIDHQGG